MFKVEALMGHAALRMAGLSQLLRQLLFVGQERRVRFPVLAHGHGHAMELVGELCLHVAPTRQGVAAGLLTFAVPQTEELSRISHRQVNFVLRVQH